MASAEQEQWTLARALDYQLEQLAIGIRRLRRRVSPDSPDAWTLTELAERVQTIDAIWHASAADLVRAGVTVEDAIAETEARIRHLTHLLGGTE